ncbi:MAG: acyltransferase [Duncaniella sp.]|nr:acyltransferase [Duncaniella sp.]
MGTYAQIENNHLINKSYSSIYCLKTLGAFFVICIHCFAPILIRPFIRTAVPIFFMISGYFLYKSDPKLAIKKSLKAVKKIFWITVYANIFYYLCLQLPDTINPFKSIISLISFLLFGANIGFHLWYIYAYIETLIVLIIFLKIDKLQFLWRSIPFCIAFGLFTGSFSSIVGYESLNNMYVTRNFITMGIPCFGIGWLIRQYQNTIMSFFNHTTLWLIVISAIALVEVFVLSLFFKRPKYCGDFYLMTFPLTTIMFLVCLRYPTLGQNTFIEKIGKEYSLYIYIFHIAILITLMKVLEIYIPESLSSAPFFLFCIPFLVFTLTIFFVIIWRRASLNLFDK